MPSAHVVIRNHYLSKKDVVMDVNSLGFRDAELPAVKAPGELRILALGDSITWADYLQAEEAYVERALLQDETAPAERRWRRRWRGD